MIIMGKSDIKSRKYPRSYAIWVTQEYYYGYYYSSRKVMLTLKRSHHESISCESQHQYICQRPAAALEGSGATGNLLSFKDKLDFTLHT